MNDWQKDDIFDTITSRHIAKLLSRLGDTVVPIAQSEIKRQMRFLTEDIKKVKKTQMDYFNKTGKNVGLE